MLGHSALCEFPLAGYGPPSTHAQALVDGVSATTQIGDVEVAISGWVTPVDPTDAEWEQRAGSDAEWEETGDPTDAEWDASGDKCGET